LNATAEGIATTSTVLDGEDGDRDSSNDDENSNDGKDNIQNIIKINCFISSCYC
jgi:hypothetical protein